MSDTAPVRSGPSLREIPSVDQLLKTDVAERLRSVAGVERLTTIARQVTDELRGELKAGAFTPNNESPSRNLLLDQALQRMEFLVNQEEKGGLRRVINATGVILHTNLGRAPLSAEARAALANEVAGYCTLEYDNHTGTRGRRGARVEQLLTELTGAEAALVVNNCAAAALLILTVLAHDGETIVSRGELVEIGGDFRVPEVMANSGTRMVDVGTTNRTHLDDYKRAISDRTRLLMRVHPSNYRVVGFTATPALTELASLAHEKGLVLYEDAGSGALRDLAEFGLKNEPVIRDSITDGADLVSFSGDKLLGGPQAGLIVGSGTLIERLRKHSLYRALRVDKLTLAVLEVTLNAHRRDAIAEVPALQMLSMSNADLTQRAERFVTDLDLQEGSDLKISLVEGESAVGGGCGPETHPATTLIALAHPQLSADEIEQRLRASEPPVISRVSEDKVLLDLRTVTPAEEPELAQAVSNLTK